MLAAAETCRNYIFIWFLYISITATISLFSCSYLNISAEWKSWWWSWCSSKIIQYNFFFWNIEFRGDVAQINFFSKFVFFIVFKPVWKPVENEEKQPMNFLPSYEDKVFLGLQSIKGWSWLWLANASSGVSYHVNCDDIHDQHLDTSVNVGCLATLLMDTLDTVDLATKI